MSRSWHQLSTIQKATRGFVCWLYDHDRESRDYRQGQACGCTMAGTKTICRRCGRDLGSISWVDTYRETEKTA